MNEQKKATVGFDMTSLNESLARADEAHMRVEFERRCLDHFKAKRAAGVPIIDDNGSPATTEALFWRDENGHYGVQAFNVAWIAYRWGVEFGRAHPGRLSPWNVTLMPTGD